MPEPFELPYELHTGRELELMLRGTKPLAHFYDAYPTELCEEIIPEHAFEPYVQNGVFEKREFVELLTRPPPTGHPHIKGIRNVLYAQPSEIWRIDSYIDMQLRLAVNGWSIELERLQGRLLGYEEWQTEIHIERCRSSENAHHFPWLFTGRDA